MNDRDFLAVPYNVITTVTGNFRFVPLNNVCSISCKIFFAEQPSTYIPGEPKESILTGNYIKYVIKM